jgi:hypothetical protein
MSPSRHQWVASAGNASRPATFTVRPSDSSAIIGRLSLSEDGREGPSPSSPPSPGLFSEALIARSGSSPFPEASSPLRLGSSPEPCFSEGGDNGDGGDDAFSAPLARIVIRRLLLLPRPLLPKLTSRPILRRFGARRLSWPLNVLARLGQPSDFAAFWSIWPSSARSSLGFPQRSWSAMNRRSGSTMG